MNSLASVLYSSSSTTKKRSNLSLQPSLKPVPTMDSKSSTKCKVSGMLFRSSTPKTSLTTAVHPVSTSSYFSATSPRSPRCSTPIFAKQRRTRPFIACELCRQRAFASMNPNKPEQKHVSYHHTTTLVHCQNQTNLKVRRRRSSIEQLLVWIV
ncbi:unnamed protein product [Adineta ricciae]|uniref:Uncharacterized protein n=2 Tax=Adineta ricciae TaxID=249248 RepID=A0A814S5A5_ADIRI|nr:unnamed protein product [Adineta ricciae]